MYFNHITSLKDPSVMTIKAFSVKHKFLGVIIQIFQILLVYH